MVERTFSFGGSGEQPVTDTGGNVDAFGAVHLGGGDSDGGSRGDTGGSTGGGDDFTFDADRHISRDRTNADGSYRRKRVRGGRASAHSRAPKAVNSASVDALTQTLIIVHAGLANFTKIREFEIDASEGKALATAVANVLVEFDIPIDSKTQAMVSLIVAGASIYGPRLYLYNERMKGQKKARAGTVVPIRPEGFGAPNGGMYTEEAPVQ